MSSLYVCLFIVVIAYLQVTPTLTVPNGSCPHGHKFNITAKNPVKPLWNKIKQLKVAVIAYIQQKLTMLQTTLAGGAGGQPALALIRPRPPTNRSATNQTKARATIFLVHHSCSCGSKNCSCGQPNCTGVCC